MQTTDVYRGSLSNTILAGRVIGAPYSFTHNTDPHNRIIKETLVKDAPIINIIPGKMRDYMSDFFSKEDQDKKVNSIKEELSKEFDKPVKTDDKVELVYDEDTVEKNFRKWIMENIDSKGKDADLRFQGFTSAYSEYFSFVNTMVTTMSLKMGVAGSKFFKIPQGQAAQNTFEEEFSRYKLQFYATNASTGTISFTNDYGDNSVAEAWDKATTSVMDTVTKGAYSGVKDTIKDVSQSTKKYTTTKDKSMNELFGIDNKTLNLFSGSKSLFMKTWKDSNMSNSINLSFKFSTPYGDRESIFDKVYLPFLMLLCLALPKQTSSFGYTAPFILKLDCPGLFSSSTCAITSFSYNIGGESQKYSVDGFPLEITVDISVEDLYPVMMMTDDPRMLRFNHSMHVFLDTLAGVAITNFSPFRNINEMILIKANSIAYLPERFGSRVKESVMDSVQNFFKGYTHGS